MNVFDAKYAKKMTRDYDLKVNLKKNFKGVSLYSKTPIKKGQIVAYYKFLVHKYDDDFEGIKNNMYTMSVYKKSGRFNPHLIGDIYEGSLRPPRHNIPFWAYFSNEPSKAFQKNPEQIENVYLDINLKENYKNRNIIKEGDTMIYKLVAFRNIKANEEITWCYGDAYHRNYVANC
jgi:hypothetical protein